MADSIRSLPQFDRYDIDGVQYENELVECFHARNRILNRKEDLILLKTPPFSNERTLAFVSFYQKLADIGHPRLAEIYQLISLQQHTHVIAVEHVDGQSFDDFIEAGITLQPGRVTLWFTQLARLIDELASSGVTNFDIHARDIVLTNDGDVVLTPSFMYNQEESTIEDNTRNTHGPVQHALHQLASIFYKTLTGASWSKHETVLYPKHVPSRLIEIVSQCLSADPSEHFQSGEEVASALEELFGVRLSQVRKTPRLKRQRKNWAIPLFLLLFLSSAIFSVILFYDNWFPAEAQLPPVAVAQPAITPASSNPPSHPESIRKLLAHRAFQPFMAHVVELRNNGELIFGRKGDFVNANRCYIFVFNRDDAEILGILAPGQTARYDLFSETSIEDVENYLSGKAAIWVMASL